MKFNHPLTKQDIVDIDRFAYEVTQNWFRRQKTEGLEYCGIHFGEVIRRYLWDKVGRALRKQYYPEAFAFEKELLSQSKDKFGLSVPVTFSADQSCLSKFRVKTKNTINYFQNHYYLKRKSCRKVILMRKSHRLSRITQGLIANENIFILSASTGCSLSSKDLHTIEPVRDLRAGDSEIQSILEAVVEGIQAEEVEIPENDKKILRHEIAYELERIAITETYFKNHKIDSVLLAGDNWPPFINFVLLARKRGIPSIYLQHGLDCEHYFADEAYADAVAVWGEERKKRYRRCSFQQPSFLEVIGNPEFCRLRAPLSINSDGDYWLWITRPHIPRKCLSPSRSPREGLDILRAFFRVLKKDKGKVLLIKPHPYDYSCLYRAEIEKYNMKDCVKLIEKPLQQCISRASVVFSEDSTGGMETMFFGKPLIHIHFAPSLPTVPFTEYGAGIPAFNKDELEEAVRKVDRMNIADRNEMLIGQRAFLSDFAGPMDGKATQRSVDFIQNILRVSG